MRLNEQCMAIIQSMTLTAMLAGVAAVQAGCGILGAPSLVQQLQQKLVMHLLSNLIAAALSTTTALDYLKRMTNQQAILS
jgi:hypothetical protein